MHTYEVEPEADVQAEIAAGHVDVDALAKEAMKFLDDPDVDNVSLARMFIERGLSENLAYWLVRESEVRKAPH